MIRHLLRLILFALAGVVLASVLDLENVANASWYATCIGVLLVVGLYGTTYDIAIDEARKHVRILFSALTFGVALKAAIIAAVLLLAFHDPLLIPVAIVLAQIDPLSQTVFARRAPVSHKAKTILALWASLDGPTILVLSIYVPTLLSRYFGIETPGMAISPGGSEFGGFAIDLLLNLLFAGAVTLVWRAVKRFRYSPLLLAPVVMIIAVTQLWMLGITLIGLFVRPAASAVIARVADWAMYLSMILLGVLLYEGINLGVAFVVAFATYFAQMAAAFILTRKLPAHDHIFIFLAQQNGTTSILVALVFEPAFPGTVGIVAPAIVMIYFIHAIANKAFDHTWKKKSAGANLSRTG